MDPVSLSLGVAPLAFSAVSGSKYVLTKLKVLRHFGKEASRLRKRLKTQVTIFLDECQLLLHDSGIDLELSDALDGLNSGEYDDQLTKHLGKRHDEVREAIGQISEQITSLGEELAELSEECPADKGKISKKAQDARNAIGVLRNKTKLEQALDLLSESTSDLRRLRKMAKAVAKPKKVRQPGRRTMPQSYGMVARYSTSFHEVLSRTWSCLNANGTHVTHTAKLLLTTGSSPDDIDLRLVLEYEAVAGTLKQNLLLLRVRSEDLTWMDTRLLTPGGAESVVPPAKRVRFIDRSACTTTQVSVSTRATGSLSALSGARSCQSSTTITMSTSTVSDLCKSKDLCRDVFTCSLRHSTAQQDAPCIGYLDSACNLRHRLLMARDRESTAIQTNSRPSVPLSAILSSPAQSTALPVNERLKLSLQLARSVLRFHSTAWWRRTWTLADLAYFDIDTELSRSLGTLHIATGLRPSSTPSPSPSPGVSDMTGMLTQVEQQEQEEDATAAVMFCGIRNMTMHSLGAALLQLGRWEALDVRDVVGVRKAAAKPTALGPRFDELVAKCLYCDFGYGADLKRPQLQTAVYEGVVCELEDMVGFLEAGPAR